VPCDSVLAFAEKIEEDINAAVASKLVCLEGMLERKVRVIRGMWEEV
jgi:hypothetical protein